MGIINPQQPLGLMNTVRTLLSSSPDAITLVGPAGSPGIGAISTRLGQNIHGAPEFASVLDARDWLVAADRSGAVVTSPDRTGAFGVREVPRQLFANVTQELPGGVRLEINDAVLPPVAYRLHTKHSPVLALVHGKDLVLPQGGQIQGARNAAVLSGVLTLGGGATVYGAASGTRS